MRSISVTTTKTHFVCFVLTDYIGDEISISDFTPVAVANGASRIGYNIVSFGVRGAANAFLQNTSSGWDYWGKYTFPMLESKFNDNPGVMRTFGNVSTSEDSLYIGLLPREDSLSSSYLDYTNIIASSEEVTRIGDTSNTSAFNLLTICQQLDMKRDIVTFNKIEETIEDLEITII
jgi:hypothetical protein